MKALEYTGTQELVYREEPNPIEISGESILKIHEKVSPIEIYNLSGVSSPAFSIKVEEPGKFAKKSAPLS